MPSIGRAVVASLRRRPASPLGRCQPHTLTKRDASDTPKRPKRRGRLFTDRDYHVHLGGAIPPRFVADWIRDGRLRLDDEIPDQVAASSSAANDSGFLPTITVRDALQRYRGIDAIQLESNGPEAFLSAYNHPAYASLPAFLTMYRAYSRRELLYSHAYEIARGEYMHPRADVRVSIPRPNGTSTVETKEPPESYATRALQEMAYYRSCLRPEQRLFVTFPRQTYSRHTNWEYFASFVDLLQSNTDGSATLETTWCFPVSIYLLSPREVCPHIPFADRIRDTMHLLPYVDRVGHGLCLGLAVLGINPDAEASADASAEATLESNRDAAYQCLHQMASSGIGIEVSPTCNITLGGARNKEILRQYVEEILRAGVDVYVATDDPGFLGTTLEEELAMLKGVDAEDGW
ncbi:hypothetical protein ACHAXT_009611 [Thalassiosira profunda]